MLISAALIGTQNIIVMIISIVIAFSIAKILVYYTEVDKIKFSDSMTKTWRKINYLESTAKNFDFGKYSDRVTSDIEIEDDTPTKKKFDLKNLDFKDERNEFNPVQTDVTDSDYLFDNEDAIIVNLKNNKK